MSDLSISKNEINKHQKDELSDKGNVDWLSTKKKKSGKSSLEELQELKEKLEKEEQNRTKNDTDNSR